MNILWITKLIDESCHKTSEFEMSEKLRKKGQKYLIETVADIVTKQKDILCIIGGSGPIRKQLHTKIKKSVLKKNIHLCGYILNEKIAYYINAADIFVLPSLSEGNPMVIFEFLGIGLPFIGTMVGGNSEIITSEEYGLLVDPTNSDQLANKIIIALNCNWNHEKIMEYGQQFTWQKIALRTIDVYKKIINFQSDFSLENI